MTFEEIRKSHRAGEKLSFSHPHLFGKLIFTDEGELIFVDIHGRNIAPPLWLSDFDRDDWYIMMPTP